MRPTYWPRLLLLSALGPLAYAQAPAQNPPTAPQANYVDASHSTLRLEVDGKTYLVNVVAGTVHPAGASSSASGHPAQSGAGLFAQNCARCHGADGRGIGTTGTPNFTRGDFQATLSDQKVGDTIRNGKPERMPAFGTEFDDQQIAALTTYVRSFASAPGSSSSNLAKADTPAANSGVYQIGDDMLFSLPSGKPVDAHSLTINFTHRFPYGSAFTSDPGSGFSPQVSQAFGLDNVALPSLGVRYGITDRLSVDLWRSPSFINRPIQLMAAYKVLDEHHEDPFNLMFRVSVEGQNNFRKNFTENIETIVSRSITSRVQLYFVPTASFNDRILVQGALVSDQILDEPGVTAFSLGTGISIDILKSVALIAEVIPTVVGGSELDIHRPPISFAIQKKIYRHAFTLGVTTSPGTTVSQRAGTNATFLGNPRADEFPGLFLGFDITRRIF